LGRTLASMPCTVPTNNISVIESRCCSSRATASPGNRWPPVPPPAKITRMLESPARETQQYSRRHQVDHHGGSTVANKRQYQALGRHQSHDDAHMDQGLRSEKHCQAKCQILLERLFDLGR